MINITSKSATMRKAVATAVVRVGRPETINAVRNNAVPKGNVLESARVAGLFAVKRTSEMIPDCHPLPVEFTQVSFHISDLEILVEVEVHTVYKTGVEVEAMHGASVVALTIYDMLKPIDKHIEIASIKLKEKSGGKSDFTDNFKKDLKAAVIVCSDSVSKGRKTDSAGKVIIDKLAKYGITASEYVIIPDEPDRLRDDVLSLCGKAFDLILVTGGTGLSPRDTTPETIRPLLDREIPGMAEAVRVYGQQRTPYAMLSRSVAGFRGGTLIIALPGSTSGAAESMDALFPATLHVFRVAAGKRHDEK